GNLRGGVTRQTGAANDAGRVLGTAAGGLTAVLTGGGDDEVVVASAAATLATLAGVLLVDAGAGTNDLLVTESGAAAADAVAVTGGSVSSSGLGFLINYQATGGTFGNGVGVITGGGADTVNVLGAPPGQPLIVYTGGGADTVNVFVIPASGYSLSVNGQAPPGGAGGDTLGVLDLSGGATVHNVPLGGGLGLVEVVYGISAFSLVGYFDFENAVTFPPAV